MSPERTRSAAAAFGAAALSGFLLALYSRVEAPWFALGWVLFTPWLADVDRASSLRSALARGALMSVAFALAVFPWFADAISRYSGTPRPLSLLLLVLFAPFLQTQTIALALSRWWLRRRGAAALRVALAGAAAYVGCEWLTGKLLGDTLGQGLYAAAWMRQAADLAGAPGLTFVLVAGNAAALELLRALRERGGARRRALAPAAALAASVLCLSGYGAWRWAQLGSADAAPRRPSITAAVVQADIADYAGLARDIGTYDAVQMILDNHIELSAAALSRKLDVLIWPETVYPTTFGAPKSPEGAELDGRIVSFAAAAATPLIFGAYDGGGGREYNAAVFLEPKGSGKRFATYRKARLFPLTEWVPRWLDSTWLRRRLPWLGSWQPGVGGTVVPFALADGRTVRVAPLICYDALDPALALAAVRGGAELIVTLSNDSWFAASAGARLHFVVAAFRSIETRRPQLRATNTGISAAFDRLGNAMVKTRLGERTAFVAAVVPERDERTLVILWGDWFGPAAAVLALVLSSVPAAKKLR